MGDGCWHVYLDVGSNRGVQVRKLYEPQLYPDALVLPLFFEQFRTDAIANKSHICSFGWEAAPVHTWRLQSLTLTNPRKNKFCHKGHYNTACLYCLPASEVK